MRKSFGTFATTLGGGPAVLTRVVSRTRLVQGLEIDHALVLNANELSTEELYVAITRPRVSLTVLR